MKVLLDECVDSRLAGHFSAVEVQTVHDRGWSGVTNGKLLALAQVDMVALVPDIQRVIPSAVRGTVTSVGRQAPP